MEATALSIAKSVLDGVLSMATSAGANEVALQLGVQRELAFIKDEFEMMQTFLETAHEEKSQSKIVKTWVKQVRDLAYDVEDCLQESALHLAKPSTCTLKARHRIANEIKELKARVEDVSQRSLRYRLIDYKDSASKPAAAAEQSGWSRLAVFGAQQASVPKDYHPNGPDFTESSSKATTSTAGSSSSVLSIAIEEPSPKIQDANGSNMHDIQIEKDPNLATGKYAMVGALEQTYLIGREIDKTKVTRLISEGHEQRQVISVWGMGGIGKTTLVKNVYESQELRSKFQTRAWILVLHPFNHEDFLKSLIIQLHAYSTERKKKSTISSAISMFGEGGIQQELAMMGINELIVKLNNQLINKTYLIVLDDLSSITEWNLIKEYLPDKNDGSRIIVTTRNANVAEYCSQEYKYVYHLESLTEEASFDLFRKKVFKENRTLTDPDMIEQAKLILKKCDGLPLAIATIGGFLATKPKIIIEWRKLYDHINFELETNPSLGEIKTILNSSYEGLPYSLKSCFLYLSIFLEGHNIRRRRLIGRWIAEGYTKKMRGINTDEIGELNFTELINRGMTQPSKTRTRKSGRIDFCQVHDLMREISISKSIEENLVFVLDEHCNSNSQDKIRHLAISSGWNRDKNTFESMMDFSHIRSLTVFGEWKSFFISDKMKLLRVLDLEDTSNLRNYHIEQVGKFYHLKYISMRGSVIFHLPNSLGNLRHLETLDIRGTFVTELPTTVVRLRKLQYLRAGCAPGGEEDIQKALYPEDCPKAFRNKGCLCFVLSVAACIALCRPKTMGMEESDRWETYEFFFILFLTVVRFVDPAGVKVPRGIGKMKALYTLGVVNVASGSSVLKEIGELTWLRKLGVTGINKKNSVEFCSAISAHNFLQSLFVRSRGEQGLLGCLENVSSPLKQLESLKLYGNLNKSNLD